MYTLILVTIESSLGKNRSRALIAIHQVKLQELYKYSGSLNQAPSYHNNIHFVSAQKRVKEDIG